METMPSEGDQAYAQGIKEFTDFLSKPSIVSWAQALNSLQTAALSTHLVPSKVADAHYRLGLLFVFDSDYRSALSYFQTCLRIQRSALAHEAMGTAHNALGEHTHSGWHYEQALSLGGDETHCYIGMGRALLEMGKIEEAIECFAKAATSNGAPEAFLWKGNAYRRAGETGKAVDSYLAGLAIHEENADLCQALAETHLEDKTDPAAAVVWFDRMYELPKIEQAKDLCRTRMPFAAYFCERYPKVSTRTPVFQALCGLRRAVVEVKEKLYCDADGAAIHYTSLDTAKALVVEKSPLRAFRADRMNDPSEGEILRIMLGADLVSELLELDDMEELPSAFITSFVFRPEVDPVGTTADDDLLHWRLYGKANGVEGGGACVAYPSRLFWPKWDTHESASLYHAGGLLAAPSILRQLTRWQSVAPRLYGVSYEGGHAEKLIVDVRRQVKRMRELKRAVATDEERTVISKCVKVLLEEIRFLFKSRDFEYEKEARVVVMVWPDERGIETQSNGKHYVEFGRDVYPTELVFGPGVVENLLPEFDATESSVKVRKSRVRYAPQ